MARPRWTYKRDPVRYCDACGGYLIRKRHESGRLEDRGNFLRRRYCDRACFHQGMKSKGASRTRYNATRRAGL